MTSATSAGRRSYAPPLWLILTGLVPTVLISLPFIYIAFRTQEAGSAWVIAELTRGRTLKLLVNTLGLALAVTLASVLIGTAAAWCIERCDLPGRRSWRIVTSLPLAIPAFVSGYAWSSIGSVFESMTGAVIILTLSYYPLVFLPIAAALRNMDRGFEDVSRSLGRGAWRTFFGVILPQARPALFAGALLVLTHMFAEFGALSLLRVQTFTTAIFESYQLQFDSATAALQSAVLIALCLPPAYGELRLKKHMQFARVGRGSRRMVTPLRLGRAKPFILLLFGILALLSLGVPLATLTYWLTVGNSLGEGSVNIWPAITGSLSLSLPGAIIVVLLAFPLVMASARHGGWLAQFIDRLPYIVHGLPGLVVALSLVFLSIRYAGPLYQTIAIIFAAYAILFLPLAQSALRASVELVPPRLEEIARSLGRTPFQAFISVTLPNIAPGISAALTLVALELMRELTATLILAPTGVVTLATEIWSHTNDGEYAAAAPFAALLVAISILPVYIFTRRHFDLSELS